LPAYCNQQNKAVVALNGSCMGKIRIPYNDPIPENGK
jgi:hypothetical protein